MRLFEKFDWPSLAHYTLSVSDAPESFIRRLGVSETVALAGFTVLGYSYAFAYEVGYLRHFGIPFWVIDLSLVHILVVIGVVAPVVAFVMFLLFPLLPPGPWWGLIVRLSTVALLVGQLVIIMIIFNWHHRWQLVATIVFGLPSALVTIGYINSRLIRPIFLYRDKGSWLERWAFSLSRELASRKPNLLDDSVATMDKAGLRVSVWLAPVWWLFVIGPIVVQYLGNAAAFYKTDYLVIAAQPECVAVRKYNDFFVCPLIDRSSHRILPAFRLIRLGDSSGRVFKIEQLGHLKAPDVAAIKVPPPLPIAAARAAPSSTPKTIPATSSSVPSSVPKTAR